MILLILIYKRLGSSLWWHGIVIQRTWVHEIVNLRDFGALRDMHCKCDLVFSLGLWHCECKGFVPLLDVMTLYIVHYKGLLYISLGPAPVLVTMVL